MDRSRDGGMTKARSDDGRLREIGFSGRTAAHSKHRLALVVTAWGVPLQ